MQLCLKILTQRTKTQFYKESSQHVLQLIHLRRSVNNVMVTLNIKLDLCSQLTIKIFGELDWRPIKHLCNVNHIAYCCDCICFTFTLGNQTGHLAPIELIWHVVVDLDRHFSLLVELPIRDTTF